MCKILIKFVIITFPLTKCFHYFLKNSSEFYWDPYNTMLKFSKTLNLQEKTLYLSLNLIHKSIGVIKLEFEANKH